MPKCSSPAPLRRERRTISDIARPNRLVAMLPNSSYLRCLLLAAVTLLLGGCGKEVERHKLDVAHLRTA